MSNMDTALARVKLLVKDSQVNDEDIQNIILHVIGDIATSTKIFKKLYGFTVHENIELYNFREIARLNEEVEQEPSSIMITDPNAQEIIDFITKGEFPDPTVEKTLESEEAKSSVIEVMDIFDSDAVSVINKFEYRGSAYYFCPDDRWRSLNDGEKFVFAAWVVPHIDELTPSMLDEILPTIVSGCKFFINDLMHSVDDTQATNYDFMRYYQAKQILLDRYPTAVTSTDTERMKQWL